MKTRTSITFLLTTMMIISSSCNFHLIKNGTYRIATVDNNVCKKLIGNVVLYAVFVDTRYTQPWTEYDIKSTLDSISKATKWIEKIASENGVSVNINVQYHQNKRMIPISNDFPNKTLSGTLFPILNVGIPKVDRWADMVAKTAGKSLPTDTTTLIKTKNRLSDRERLIARLRDIYKTDNVVLMYFINNYYKEEVSVTLHNASMTNIEYSVVSFKQPAVIAHEFLHIFGALDLYVSPFDNRRAARRRKEWAMKEYPNEVMAFAYRKIDSLNVSTFTKYLIGWENQMDDKSRRMLFGKKIKFLKY